jgi:hypothetical protein
MLHEERPTGPLCGCKVEVGHYISYTAVDLFRKRASFISGAKSSFYMAKRDVPVEGRKRGDQYGSSIALSQNTVGLDRGQNLVK